MGVSLPLLRMSFLDGHLKPAGTGRDQLDGIGLPWEEEGLGVLLLGLERRRRRHPAQTSQRRIEESGREQPPLFPQ